MPDSYTSCFEEFIRDGGTRIARLADPSIINRVPQAFRSAAASVARQAAGGWSLATPPGTTFAVDVAMRKLRIGMGFAARCTRVAELVSGSTNPELYAIFGVLGNPAAVRKAVMSAFFHYFAAHEFMHVEQGLGSDQYRDSDFYMPVVMEADYVADAAGLVIAVEACVPELAELTKYQSAVLLMAIHIASMHSFEPSRRPDNTSFSWIATALRKPRGLDANTFSRLLVWYIHFARVTKAGICPVFESPTFMRSWIVMLPRLVASNRTVTLENIATRKQRPYEAGSDVVLAYHAEDGLYRIHRAAFTDVNRTHRLCVAILQEDFDTVRAELEELLVFNPALIPVERRRNIDVEWITAGLIETLDGARDALKRGDATVAASSMASVRGALNRLSVMMRDEAARDASLDDLIRSGDRIFEELEPKIAKDTTDAASAGALLLRLVSLVDQIAVHFD